MRSSCAVLPALLLAGACAEEIQLHPYTLTLPRTADVETVCAAVTRALADRGHPPAAQAALQCPGALASQWEQRAVGRGVEAKRVVVSLSPQPAGYEVSVRAERLSCPASVPDGAGPDAMRACSPARSDPDADAAQQTEVQFLGQALTEKLGGGP